MHVVIVDEELPYPANSGKRIRSLNLTMRLARRHRVTYLSHRNADAAEARQAEQFFGDHGIESVVVDRAVPPKKGWRFYGRLGLNLLSRLPYSVATHSGRALSRRLHEYAAENHVDLWQCEWTPYAQSVGRLRGVPWLVIAHNVESMIWQRYFETESHPAKRWYIKRQWHKFERFERRVFSEATQVVAVSEEDAALARDRFGAPRVAVVDNGVDTAYFRPAINGRAAQHILFLGSLDWRPNLDAIQVMLQQVFPAVLAREPAARLCIVGRNPPQWLIAAAHESDRVELHANVPDVRPFLHRCGMLAVPLRIGGGSRLKILEALAAELPVVSTKVGAEGLRLEGGRDLVVVDRVDQMAAALVQCIRTPKQALATARAGRRRVLEDYDWSSLADKLEGVWTSCLNGTAKRQQ